MKQYEVVFRVDGRRTETVVSAYTRSDAEKLVEAQYSGSKVSIIRISSVN